MINFLIWIFTYQNKYYSYNSFNKILRDNVTISYGNHGNSSIIVSNYILFDSKTPLIILVVPIKPAMNREKFFVPGDENPGAGKNMRKDDDCE